jgi:penicillin-binding protein 2
MPHPAVDMGLRADRLKLVREGLLAVVNEPGGTAYKYTRMKGVQIAGKTGTAETGLPDENNAWFAGWAPYDNPQICVVVVIERTRGHGGEVAGPVAKQIFQAYFGIQESSESENEK